MPPQISPSLTEQLLCIHTDDNVSQEEKNGAHDTDSYIRLLAHRPILVLVNQLNNGNLPLPLPPNA